MELQLMLLRIRPILAALPALAGLISVLPAAPPPVAAPEPAAPGRTTQRIVCEADAQRSYALYLPSGYVADRAWPTVVLMDPRGRALIPLELFRPAAERFGYILASSYDTASDGPREPNERAVNAMLPDLQRRFNIDRRRLYLAGFSGTARAGWDFAHRLKGSVAGLIGLGAGLPPGFEPPRGTPVDFFGGAGTTDFNFEELLALDARLDRTGMTHRIRFYGGGHSWPPEPICSEALGWMELQAMRRGLREADPALIASLHEERMRQARTLEAAGELHEARRAYSAIAEDFPPPADTGEAARRVGELSRHKAVRRAESQLRHASSRRKAYEARLSGFLESFAVASPPPDPPESLRVLQIDRLKREAARIEDDRLAAQAAIRLIEQVFVHVSFYEPMSFLARGEAGRALAMLKVADAIREDNPSVWYNMARSRAQIGQTAPAMEALERAVSLGIASADLLESDRYLEPLRGEPGYRALLARMRAAPPPAP
ncbi:MAG TPA: tetratricopeptide repeat protein [Candidatus Polarisedimenticolia bacterium]|nr:tetratricopeptide repeat protein [Candidatus Polarisedimenticolia bacterium]